MDVMTHEQMWKRYKTLMKDKPSDYKIRCHLCNEVIGEGDPDIEYSKTKSGSELFFHGACAAHWGDR